MLIKKVDTLEEAKYCNQLLTKLIHSEQGYNPNLNSEFIVDNWFESFYDQPSHGIFVAKENGRIVGYIYCKIISIPNGPTKNIEALIDGLYVEEEYREAGIASSLFDNVKKWLKEKNVKYVKLEVLSKNERALKMYSKIGFVEMSKILYCELS